MNGTLYLNGSQENYINKDIAHSLPITLHFKEDSSVQNPTIYINRTINIGNKNYIKIDELHRYYYIDEIILSQQQYICKCRCDVLMSFKSQFMKSQILLERTAKDGYYGRDLEDDRAKLYQHIHCDCIRFKGEAFKPDVQNFLLSVVGNPNINASVTAPESGKKPENNGGSGKQHSVMTDQEYEQTTPEENENTVIVVSNRPVGASYNTDSLYSYIKESQYNALSQSEQENGTFYYLSDKANGTYGTRNIEVSAAIYAELTNKAKNNSTPYFVR